MRWLTFNPELVRLMRTVLEEVMARVPDGAGDARHQGASGRDHPEGGGAGRDDLRRPDRGGVKPDPGDRLDAELSRDVLSRVAAASSFG